MCGVASPLLYQTRAPARLGELGVNFGELRVRGEGASHDALSMSTPYLLTYLICNRIRVINLPTFLRINNNNNNNNCC